MRVAKTPTYHAICPFPIFVASCDHNPVTLITNGQTDRHHARSISATCYIRYGICPVIFYENKMPSVFKRFPMKADG